MVRKCWETNNAKSVDLPKVNLTIDNVISSKDSDAGSHADPIRKHIKYGTSFQAAKGIFLEYFNDSTIHGFKYIGDQKRSTFERIVWLFFFVASIVICCFLIQNILDKHHNNPVITTFNEKPTALWEIPFPSVTICPETKTRANIFNFTEVYWKIEDNKTLTKEEQFYWEAVSQSCRVTPISYGNDFANVSDLTKAFLRVTSNYFWLCLWRNISSCDIFEGIFTKEGLCFTFNLVNGKYFIRDEYLDVMDITGNNSLDWNLENGYGKEAGYDTFPYRAQATGEEDQLHLILNNRREDSEYICRNFVAGYKVILHTPGELPQVSKNFIHIPFDHSASISIRPEILNTSDELRDYEPKKRQCYFENEGHLKYFKLYSKANCELECLSNRTLDKCGCVKFSMPRSASHPVCGAGKLYCLSIVEKSLRLTKFKDVDQCNCLPSCKTIQYIAELEHQIPIDLPKMSRALRMGGNTTRRFKENYGLTEIKISFKAETFNALRRSKLYSISDFIANCGGLLGLFMGVSILSLVELVYFFTIRLWANLKMRKAKQNQMRILTADAS